MKKIVINQVTEYCCTDSKLVIIIVDSSIGTRSWVGPEAVASCELWAVAARKSDIGREL